MGVSGISLGSLLLIAILYFFIFGRKNNMDIQNNLQKIIKNFNKGLNFKEK